MNHPLEESYIAAMERGELKEARRIVGEILKEWSTSSKYMNDMGVLYFIDKQIAFARVHFACALIFEPTNELARENLEKASSELAKLTA